MKRNVAFICVGQAGGNIGYLFEKKGYNVLYLNTAEGDLKSLDKASNKYHLKGGVGSAGNRDKAKQLLAEDFDGVIEKIRETITEKYVFVVFSSGGGTGSGQSPLLLDILLEEFGEVEEVEDDALYVPEPEKYFSAITILPAGNILTEARNSYNCCKDLKDVEGLGATFILDNETRSDKFVINRIFADNLDRVLSIPSEHCSSHGAVDEEELKRAIFCTPGMAVIGYLPKEKSSLDALITQVRTESIYAPIQNDGVVMNYVTSTIDELDFEELSNTFGQPNSKFSARNDKCDILLMTGLNYPLDRLSRLSRFAKDTTAKVQRNLASLATNQLTEELEDIAISNQRKPRRKRVTKPSTEQQSGQKVQESVVVEETPKASAKDLLARYRRH